MLDLFRDLEFVEGVIVVKGKKDRFKKRKRVDGSGVGGKMEGREVIGL